jgi:hypothetical protein
MQQGMVTFHQDAEWYETVRNEMLRFPAGVHDDCVDSGAWLANLAIDSTPPAKPKTDKPKSWRDTIGAGGYGTVGHMAA